MSRAENESRDRTRLRSLDQFRGYTVLGMLLVNFVGGFLACPRILKHTNDYCSYADTIMPHFFFAVGFSLRLTYGRKYSIVPGWSAPLRIIRRIAGLLLVALIVYSVSSPASNWDEFSKLGWSVLATPLKREWFQTLTHIAVTSLWILPVVTRSIPVRWLWLCLSATGHVVLSYWFNFEWVNSDPTGIDGGPLGFLTWSIPALMGTIACDWIVDAKSHATLFRKVAGTAILLMLLGYILSCGTRFYDVPTADRDSLMEQKLSPHPVIPKRDGPRTERSQWHGWFAEPPFVPPPGTDVRKWNYWMMSQRAGTLSYLTFSAGFSLAIYLFFFWIADKGRCEVPLFRTFGTNALAAYILHGIVMSAIKPFVPKDSPGWYVSLALVSFFIVNWLLVRNLEKQGIHLKV